MSRLASVLGGLLLALSPGMGQAQMTATALTSAYSSTDATSYTTASISPPGERLIVAFVTSRLGTTPNAPTLTGNGLTWVQINTTAAQNERQSLFRATGPAPTSGTVTIDFAGQTQTSAAWHFLWINGADVSGAGSRAIGQSNTTSGANVTTLTVTLSAFADPSNRPLAGFGKGQNTQDNTPESGWVEPTTEVGGTPSGLTASVQWNQNSADATATVSWASGADGGGVAVEIRADPHRRATLGAGT